MIRSLWIFIIACVLVCLPRPSYAMKRSLPVIVAAIQYAAPGMSKTTATSYAKLIRKEAIDRRFDPFTMVAMVYYESHWNPTLENHIGCVGLGQVCPQFLWPYCNSGGEKWDQFRCKQKKAELKNGFYNLKLIAQSITANRKFCRKKVGIANWRHWLPSHGGYNSSSKGIWCGRKRIKGRWRNVAIPKTVSRIMVYRKKLIRKFARGQRKAVKRKAKRGSLKRKRR